MNKIILKALVSIAIGLYLVAAFITFKLNPGNWSTDARFLVAVAWFVVSLIAIFEIAKLHRESN